LDVLIVERRHGFFTHGCTATGYRLSGKQTGNSQPRRP
jgi:hypothetical protein